MSIQDLNNRIKQNRALGRARSSFKSRKPSLLQDSYVTREYDEHELSQERRRLKEKISKNRTYKFVLLFFLLTIVFFIICSMIELHYP